MKKIIILFGLVFSVSVINGGLFKPSIVEKGANHRVVQWEEFRTNEVTGKASSQKHEYVELANGMHYLDEKGRYEETKEEIKPVAGGAVCFTGPHKVRWSANINSHGAIELYTPDGLHLKSHVSCIAYANDKKSVVIAKVKDSIGKLVAPNQILYEDCFEGEDVVGSLRYTYTRDGFEQDVLFEQLPDTSAFDLGDDVYIQVITEFIDPPEVISDLVSTNNVNQSAGVDVNLGAMRFGQGKAFGLKETVYRQNEEHLPARKSDGVNTYRHFIKQNNRAFLIEEIEHKNIKLMLNGIKPQVQVKSNNKATQWSEEIIYPVIPKRSNSNQMIELAQANTKIGPAVAIDYVVLNTINNFVFAGDTTYYLSGNITISGVATFEGGSVIKATNGATLTITGGIEDRTSTYLPITFTAKDDNSIGETIFGSTGNPQNYYASTALNLNNYQSDLKNLRIFYADQAIVYSDPGNGDSVIYYSHQLWNSQIINCGRGIVSQGGLINLRNILMYNVRTNFQNLLNNVTNNVEHLTVNQSDKLNAGSYITLNITNSLIVNEGDSSGITQSNAVVIVNRNDVFKTVGAAAHYLADNSPYRNIGSTDIHPGLKDEFRLRTTFPPMVLSSMTVTNNTEFTPQVERDIDIPDLGYHYAALDYAVNNCFINNASVKIKPGTAIGVFGGYGFAVNGSASLECEGTPENLNRIVSYNLVQEQANTNWVRFYSALIGNYPGVGSEQDRVYFRFTDFSLSTMGYHLMFEYQSPIQPVIIKDCQFHNGRIFTDSSSLQFTNCLFERLYTELDGCDNPLDIILWNNTLYGGGFRYDSTKGGNWDLHNNIFDNTTISIYSVGGSNFIHSFNAYLYSCATNGNRLLPANSNDVIVTRFGYVRGPLGRYYLGTNSPLINAGSLTNVGDIGLYHYTVRQDQVKEANSRLDIGYHYVAVDLSVVTNSVWWDDSVPPNSVCGFNSDTWQWISANPSPYSGSLSHQSQVVSGLHQHYFDNVPSSYRITPGVGDTLFCYVYIDPTNPPNQLMLQWLDTSWTGWWRHRAYWGTMNNLWPGIYMGPLPLEGGWVRLEVPASAVNAEGKEIYGMAFSLYNGRSAWDYSGISRRLAPYKPIDTDSDGLADWFEDSNGNGICDGNDLACYSNPDSDGDGMNDGNEYALGRNPQVNGITTGSTGLTIFTPLK